MRVRKFQVYRRSAGLGYGLVVELPLLHVVDEYLRAYCSCVIYRETETGIELLNIAGNDLHTVIGGREKVGVVDGGV